MRKRTAENRLKGFIFFKKKQQEEEEVAAANIVAKDGHGKTEEFSRYFHGFLLKI
jgi:hypothetical protein